jgi:hypothetical protein
MHLQTAESAILSAVIFNALIIIALIPLALRGVKYTTFECCGSAETQPAELWVRRRDCTVCWDKGDRCDCARDWVGREVG